MNQNKKKTKHFYGVVVNTEYGLKAIAVNSDNVPTQFDILQLAVREHEQELRRRHLPVQGYCLEQKRESVRLNLVHRYENLVKNIKSGNYQVGIVRTI